jgi:SAM-dependent methyltransferase
MDAMVGGSRSASASVLDQLGMLADPTRARILAALDGIELTVAELCDVVALPQSTVSRHLRTLADGGWVQARRDGTSRYYTLTVDRLDDPSRRLWQLVRDGVGETHAADHDRRRRDLVLDRRRVGSAAFFQSAAQEWDALRAQLFGATSDLQVLPALVDPNAVVADLGCGSGRITAAIAPYVREMIAVDSSPEMLRVARARLAQTPNTRLLDGRLEALPLADDTVDIALVIHVLHHLPDPPAAIDEAARVLRPGGRLVVADMLPHSHDEYRRTMGHIWLGFSRAYITDSLSAAGLVGERWHEPAPGDGARGPGLFVATARRPTATPTPIATMPQGGAP